MFARGRKQPPRGTRRACRGAAVVEMAIVTPLLLTLVFGIIEFGWAFMVRQALINAAREGCRTAVLPGSTDEDVYDRIREYLAPMGLSPTIELTRGTDDDPTETVVLSIPYSRVSLVGNFFGSTDFDLTATCTMQQ